MNRVPSGIVVIISFRIPADVPTTAQELGEVGNSGVMVVVAIVAMLVCRNSQKIVTSTRCAAVIVTLTMNSTKALIVTLTMNRTEDSHVD